MHKSRNKFTVGMLITEFKHTVNHFCRFRQWEVVNLHSCRLSDTRMQIFCFYYLIFHRALYLKIIFFLWRHKKYHLGDNMYIGIIII